MDHYTPTAADLERFWSRVDRPSAIRQPHDPASEPAELAEGCWPWTAGTNSRGYGRIRWNGQAESANRIVWMLTHGPIPNQQRVLTTCANPRCCNPAHLTLASPHAKIQRKAAGTPSNQQPLSRPSAPNQRGPVVSHLRQEIDQLRAEIQQLKERQP